MASQYFCLGIDTSCYTTSLAIINDQGDLVSEKRQVLQVTEGKRGLQQSEALFQHLLNLPKLWQDLAGEIKIANLALIAVSTRPRPHVDSYMPVFLAGKSFAQTLATTLKIPLLETTHQEGHLAAAFYHNIEVNNDMNYYAVHCSGGTTEILSVQTINAGVSFATEIIGGSLDLKMGQLLDRLGVVLGAEFPAGPVLETWATNATENLPIKVKTKDGYFNLSGFENILLKYKNQGTSKENIALAMQNIVVECLSLSLIQLLPKDKQATILMFGGVLSNIYIREQLKIVLQAREKKWKLVFAMPRLSSDNAVGVAKIGIEKIKRKGVSIV
ncbi:MAG: O-sialoglycoprotein endopeptidase [Clostridia bacterium]